MLNFKNVNIVTILLIIVVVVGHFILNFSLLWLVPIILVWFTLTAIGSFHIGWNYHLDSLLSNPDTKKQQVAITFDDGPHPKFTPKVLDLLSRFNAKATFFCIGKNIEKHPELLKKIIADGHTVGNHTFSHANNFGFLSTVKVIDELHRTNAIIKEVSGFQSKLYRRVCHGSKCYASTNVGLRSSSCWPSIARHIRPDHTARCNGAFTNVASR